MRETSQSTASQMQTYSTQRGNDIGRAQREGGKNVLAGEDRTHKRCLGRR